MNQFIYNNFKRHLLAFFVIALTFFGQSGRAGMPSTLSEAELRHFEGCAKLLLGGQTISPTYYSNVAKVKAYIGEIEPEIFAALLRWQSEEKASEPDSSALAHDDPGACRFCESASSLTHELLTKRFPDFEFRKVRTKYV